MTIICGQLTTISFFCQFWYYHLVTRCKNWLAPQEDSQRLNLGMGLYYFLRNGHYWHRPAGTEDTISWAPTWDQYFPLDRNLTFLPFLSSQSEFPTQCSNHFSI